MSPSTVSEETVVNEPPEVDLSDAKTSKVSLQIFEPSAHVTDLEKATNNNKNNNDNNDNNNNNNYGPTDGGYGWAVVLSVFLGNFVLFGFASTWGIFQEAYYTSTFQGRATLSQLSLTGSLMIGFTAIFGSVIGKLLAFWGPRPGMAVGTVLLSLGLILASFTTELWQLYLTQGVMYGMGGGFFFVSGPYLISQWFYRRRGIAMGLSASGSCIGALVASPLIEIFIYRLGIARCQQIMGVASFVILSISTILTRTRTPPTRRSVKAFDFALLARPDFILWLVATILMAPTYMIPLFFIPNYASTLSLSSQTGSNLIAVFSAINGVGRLLVGHVSDRIGPINALILSYSVSGISIFFWPLARAEWSLYLLVIAHGTLSGAFFALVGPATVQMAGVENMTAAVNFLYLAVTIGGGVSGPVGGTALGAGGYRALAGLVGGGMLFAAGLLIVAGRLRARRQ